ncbi:MAG: cytochrome c-type biogenesis protein CcmH [Bdellovibrionales bacterium]|nr:cytochrome c-type biogenesis protein CcmH [Bdellovibrionales bacterium]
MGIALIKKIALGMLSLFFTMGSLQAFAQSSLENQAKLLESRLMAPCCWGGSLDQHFSPVSQEMKQEIRSRLQGGESSEQILQSFEQKYGERVLAQPKAEGINILAWVIPLLGMLIGVGIVMLFFRSQLYERSLDQRRQPEPEILAKDSKSQRYEQKIDQELYRS